MKVEYAWYETLPPEAAAIRQAVFVKEQGFADEFDEQDEHAWHLVLWTQGVPAATCRLFWEESQQRWVVGRIAVLAPYRLQGLGAAVLQKAEANAASLGGQQLWLHAQQRAALFYEKLGYRPFGEPDEEQGCPHIWMCRTLTAADDR